MNKLLIAVTGMMLGMVSAMAAEPPEQQSAQTNAPATYYWLHPKLGMVKVERATGFMVVSRKQQQPQTRQEPKSGHDHSRVHKLM